MAGTGTHSRAQWLCENRKSEKAKKRKSEKSNAA
jgi:hypothetical protein